MQPQPIEYTQPVQYTQPGAIPQPSQYQQPATQYVQTTQPVQQFQQPAPQMMAAPQQVVYVNQVKPKSKVPWIAVALIIVSLFLPYISIFGELNYSGFEMMGEVGEVMSDIDSDDSGDGSGDSGDSADVPTEFVFFGIAMLMVGLSPFVFLLSAIISSIVLASGKSPKVMGILHLGYGIIFLIVAAIGTVDFVGISFSMYDFTGFGFYVGAFASGLLLVE
ncbi:MAG: hypothetical protein ACPHA0_04995 [Candidatus Poseidoniaceae archaeon]